ncbi:hypothetical protein FAES_2289 [Fibrella aestuarina BUZ 2]|uniref:Uncharacterized protein n=1 Tax=Fibrella aestuarina BUZ 2 TaxID=1166018 RepID=I0K845_9BACT|nr:hypothetical protein [Fibrella aestuarina]CCH00298.1 hypothetical protein FAES_2289 [Fibrella aestuarina BUZ 2]
MYNLDSNKIDGVLKSLGNAGKNAVAALNAMTNGEFKGSALETDPLGNLGYIVRTLQNAKDQAAINAQFAGKTPEEITAIQEQARADEQAAIQAKFNEQLAEMTKEPEPEPEPDEEGAGSEDDPNQPQN